MEGDKFSDPRRRAARRPRGGARGRGRGRGQLNFRGSQKRPANVKPRAAPNLGSNEYRFRNMEEYEDEEGNAYDVGADFEEVASQPMYDPGTTSEDAQSNVNLSEELAADFSKLESVLASVPLWVRLGDHSRFALGVPEDDKIENYLDPLPETGPSEDLNASPTNDTDTEFLRELAGLSFDEDAVTSNERPAQVGVASSNDQQGERHEDDRSAPNAQEKQEPLSSSPNEERDDFDKWLDEI